MKPLVLNRRLGSDKYEAVETTEDFLSPDLIFCLVQQKVFAEYSEMSGCLHTTSEDTRAKSMNSGISGMKAVSEKEMAPYPTHSSSLVSLPPRHKS